MSARDRFRHVQPVTRKAALCGSVARALLDIGLTSTFFNIASGKGLAFNLKLFKCGTRVRKYANEQSIMCREPSWRHATRVRYRSCTVSNAETSTL